MQSLRAGDGSGYWGREEENEAGTGRRGISPRENSRKLCMTQENNKSGRELVWRGILSMELGRTDDADKSNEVRVASR